METEQIIQIVILLALMFERIIKNTKSFKSKCCCVEVEQSQFSPKNIELEKPKPSVDVQSSQ